jgi:hypothetical protein
VSKATQEHLQNHVSQGYMTAAELATCTCPRILHLPCWRWDTSWHVRRSMGGGSTFHHTDFFALCCSFMESHPEIPILECEPFSLINLNFQKHSIWFKLKWFYFLFKWVQRIKIFKWHSNFLLKDSFIWVVKIFKQKVLSPKVYSKEFSSLNLHSKKVYKSL